MVLCISDNKLKNIKFNIKVYNHRSILVVFLLLLPCMLLIIMEDVAFCFVLIGIAVSVTAIVCVVLQRKNWKRRYLVLAEDSLLYFKDEQVTSLSCLCLCCHNSTAYNCSVT